LALEGADLLLEGDHRAHAMSRKAHVQEKEEEQLKHWRGMSAN